MLPAAGGHCFFRPSTRPTTSWGLPPQRPLLLTPRAILHTRHQDGSGYLEPAEAVAALTKIGSKLKFEDLDTDGDQRVSFEEFSIFTKLMGKHTHPIFKGASQNTDTDDASKTGISVFAGSAHMNEAFMQTASKAWRKLSSTKSFDEKSLWKAFRTIDLDADGFLDPGEIRLAIKNVAPQISSVEITLMLATADTDNDGKITFAEWRDLMLHDHASDVPYWERYGKRDMNTGS